MIRFIQVIAILVTVVGFVRADPIEVTDVTGEFTLTVEIIEMVGASVKVKRVDGAIIKLPLSNFNRDSLIKIVIEIDRKAKATALENNPKNPFNRPSTTATSDADEPASFRALRLYQEAKTVGERYDCVVQHPTTKRAMNTSYADRMGRPFENSNIRIFAVSVKEVPVGKSLELLCEYIPAPLKGVQRYKYIVRHTPDGYKVNWEASAGWHPVRLATFIAQTPPTESTFRVKCSLSNYWNYEFREYKATHLSVQMRDIVGKSLHGYIRRDSKAGRRIAVILNDGNEHNLTVNLKYIDPNGNSITLSDSNGELASITRLVSESWIIDE